MFYLVEQAVEKVAPIPPRPPPPQVIEGISQQESSDLQSMLETAPDEENRMGVSVAAGLEQETLTHLGHYRWFLQRNLESRIAEMSIFFKLLKIRDT